MQRLALLLAFLCFVAASPTRAMIDFTVFFHPGDPTKLEPVQWQITAEAHAVLREVAAVFKQEKTRYLLLAGYDDNASTFALSYERSRLRGDATKKVLVDLGVPAEAIAIKACAFSEPFGRADGPEPLNRRVLVHWLYSTQDLVERDREVCPGVLAPKAGIAPR